MYKGSSYTLCEVYSSRAKAVAEAESLETAQHADVVVQPRGSSFGVYAFIHRRPTRNPTRQLSYGRIDYMPRLKKWRVIRYRGTKDIPVGDFNTQEDALSLLHDIASQKGKTKKNPALMVIGNPRKKNPPSGDLMSDSVHEVRYTHRQDGAPYKHTFKAGVRMVANTDGTITLYHPTKRIHEEFPN